MMEYIEVSESSLQYFISLFLSRVFFVDVAEWHNPMAGMFLWIKLKDIKDTQRLIMERALEKEVHTHTHLFSSHVHYLHVHANTSCECKSSVCVCVCVYRRCRFMIRV